jgi:Protein of unknown function (DUF3572)
MTPETAETIALKALGFLAESPDGLPRLMELSGLDTATLRQRAAEPEFLSFVLSWILGEETLLTEFCERDSIPARDVHLAQHVLAPNE